MKVEEEKEIYLVVWVEVWEFLDQTESWAFYGARDSLYWINNASMKMTKYAKKKEKM